MFVGVTCGHEFWGLETFALVEQLGYDGLFCGDHVFMDRPVWDAITMCTAMACATQRIAIGPAAVVPALRHPTMLAKELIGIDRISGGRLVVAVGAGGNSAAEFAAVGVAVESRGRRTTESIELLLRYFAGERVSYDGETVTVDDVQLQPPPCRDGGPPIWVAGRKQPALRRAALHGHGFLPYMFTPAQCATAFDRIAVLADEAGRVLPPDFVRGAYVYMALGTSREEAVRRADAELARRYSEPRFRSELSGRYAVAGDPDSCMAGLREFVDAGCTHLIVHLVPGEGETPPDTLTAVARDVLAPLRDAV